MTYKDQHTPAYPNECYVLDDTPMEKRRDVLNPYNVSWNSIALYMSVSGTMHRVYIVDKALERMRKAPKRGGET